MQLNLRPIMAGTGSELKELDFDCALDLSSVSRYGEKPFVHPVTVNGTARCQNGVITLTYTAEFLLEGDCARCLEPVKRPESHHLSHTVVESVSHEQADNLFVVAPGGRLDLLDLVASDLLLQQEGILLCRKDCEGLCPQCGTNRNTQQCHCAL